LFSPTVRLPGNRMSHSCHNTYRHAGHLVSNSNTTCWTHRLYLNARHTGSIWTVDTQAPSERWTHWLYLNAGHTDSIWTQDTQAPSERWTHCCIWTLDTLPLSERWTHRLHLNAGHTGSIWTQDTQNPSEGWTHRLYLNAGHTDSRFDSTLPSEYGKFFVSSTTVPVISEQAHEAQKGLIFSLQTFRAQRTPPPLTL
jgi:hypothetical protein